MKKKAVISSLLTIALCLCLIAGSTYAMFTADTSVNIAVNAANVALTATVDPTVETSSLGVAGTNGSFANGGAAGFNATTGELNIERMTPGDAVTFTIKATNSSNVAIQYKVSASSTIGDGATKDLSEALTITVTIGGTDYVMDKTNGESFATAWIPVAATNGVGGAIGDITVKVEFPNSTVPGYDNQFKGAAAKIAFAIEAIQGNGDPATITP